MMERFGYGDAGHEFDPDRHGRCRKAGSGYCDGTRTDPQHDRRIAAIERVLATVPADLDEDEPPEYDREGDPAFNGAFG